MRAPLTDEFVAAFQAMMTTHDPDLFNAALNRARELVEEVDHSELTQDETNRLLLDSSVVAMAMEWGARSYEEGCQLLIESRRGTRGFYAPEFTRYLRSVT